MKKKGGREGGRKDRRADEQLLVNKKGKGRQTANKNLYTTHALFSVSLSTLFVCCFAIFLFRLFVHQSLPPSLPPSLEATLSPPLQSSLASLLCS
jgi:hypothetical protein